MIIYSLNLVSNSIPSKASFSLYLIMEAGIIGGGRYISEAGIIGGN
jgi:hypothetical protein